MVIARTARPLICTLAAGWLVGCRAPAPAPPPPAPAREPAFARERLAESALAVAAAPPLVVLVPARGAVAVGRDAEATAPVALDVLAARLAGAEGAEDAGGEAARTPASDGATLVRVDTAVGRPLVLVDRDLPAIRVLEVAGAAAPVGIALAVVDRARPGIAAFGFRWADPGDPVVAADEPVAVELGRHAVTIAGRGLPLIVDPAAVRAAVPAASQVARLSVTSPQVTVGQLLGVVEALAAAGITRVQLVAGRPGVPLVVVGEPVVRRGAVDPRVARRFARRALPAFVRCYAALHPLRAAHAELAFEVTADGRPESVSVTHDQLDDATATCLASALSAVTLWTGKPSSVTVPLELEPEGGS